MNRRTILRLIIPAAVAVLSIGAGMLGIAANTAAGGQPQQAGRAAPGLVAAERGLRSQGTPDAVLATFDHGSITASRTLGDAGYDADTPFYVGSVSKSLAAVTAVRLVQRGTLSLDHPVTSYLPWFRVEGASDRITIRHLLNQTSGLPQWAGMTDLTRPDTTLEQRVRELAPVRLTSEPGSRFTYCNKNFAVLALIIETVTGLPYAETLRAEVLEPLEMSGTFLSPAEVPAGELAGGNVVMFGAHVPWPTTHYPAALADGYVISSARDLATFADVLTTGQHRRSRFLTAELLSELRTPPVSVPADADYGSRYGMGLRISTSNREQSLWHEGELATFHANLGVFPKTRRGLVVLTTHNNQLFAGDAPFLAGMAALADAEPDPDDGGFRAVALGMVVAAALTLAAMIADVGRWPSILRRPRTSRLLRQAIPRAALAAVIGLGTFFGLGSMFGLPGPLPVSVAWVAAPDLTGIVLGVTGYLALSAILLTGIKQRS
jgi:CubicO group peptidase (beta-lactamase class C family)